MEILHERCAGLDVHKDTVVACIRIANKGLARNQVRTFGTTTKELLALDDWLAENECTHAAMEATGVYWKPVWHILESSVELVLAKAADIRNRPGRKTDVNDATWIAELFAHGLIRPSFVPDQPIQDLRDLTRNRKQMVGEVTRYVLRIQKTLQDANLKVGGVITDLVGGVSGRAVLEAIIQGESDPEKLYEETKGRLKASREKLVEALDGRIREQHRFLLKLYLEQIDRLNAAIEQIEARLEVALQPYRQDFELLTTIPGVSTVVAGVLLAEIGCDMSRFPTAVHLVSWAGLCPQKDESAGKRRSNRSRKGSTWLKTTLIEAAQAASRKKNSYFRAQYYRLRARRGPGKAMVAVAASILTSAYHILTRQEPYRDLGPEHFHRLDPNKRAQNLIKRLKDLGFEVEVKRAA